MAYENFYATKLQAAALAGDTTLTVQRVPDTITSGWLVLEARNATQREIVWFSGVSGNNLTGVTRGQQGTTAVGHAASTSVEMNPTAQDFTDALAINSNIPQTLRDVFGDSANELAFAVLEGLDWSKDVNLTGDMTDGVVYINGAKIEAPAITGKVFTVSKDTYVSIDASGAPVYTEVANNAAQPTKPAGTVWVAKVITDGTEITSAVSIKERAVKNFVLDRRAIDGLHPTPRLTTTTTATSVTPNLEEFNQYEFSALTTGITINAPVGYFDGDPLIIRLKGTAARAITWNAAFVGMGVDLPTTTVTTKWTYIGAIYNAAAAKWHVLSVAQEE